MLAHSYMSTKCDVSAIITEFPDVPLQSFVMKAAQKAFTKVVSQEDLTVSRVNYQTNSMTNRTTLNNINELRVGQIQLQLENETSDLKRGNALI